VKDSTTGNSGSGKVTHHFLEVVSTKKETIFICLSPIYNNNTGEKEKERALLNLDN